MPSMYDSLIKNGTQELVPKSRGGKIIGHKWVFKTKLQVDKTLEKYKSRELAKGFHQTECIDYTETFSPVVKPTLY